MNTAPGAALLLVIQRTTLVALVAALTGVTLSAVFLTGCGAGPNGAGADTSAARSAPAAAAAATSGPRPGADRDPCALLTRDEVSAIYGSAVVGQPAAEGSVFISCGYVDPASSNMFVLGYEVYRQGGLDRWRNERLAVAGASRMLQHAEKDVDVASVFKQTAFPNLGDQAVFGLQAGHVLKGDTLISFKFGLLRNPDAHFRALAEKVLSRL